MAPDPRSLRSVGDQPTRGAVWLRSVGELPTEAGELPETAPTASFEAPPPPGYAVEKELGRGAFGVVYLARHEASPDTPVALKVVAARGRMDRLLLEPALLAKLDHPNVVRVLDYFPHPGGGHLVIALEYVGGGDLQTALAECERFPACVVRDVLVQLGGALAEAHGKGVVHRDLKPANVLLDRSAGAVRYVLSDFGVGDEDHGLRTHKSVAGTYLFMAPEQLRGRPGPASDLWALGVVAYRMLTGAYPFPGPSAADLARQIQLATPPPPSEVTGEPLDPALERTVLKLLDRTETERIGSAAELFRELGVTAGPKAASTLRPTPRPSAARGRSLDAQLRAGERRADRWTGVWVGLYLLLHGVAAGLLVLAALRLFFVAHLRLHGRRKAAGLGAALALLWAPHAARRWWPDAYHGAETLLFGVGTQAAGFAQRLQAKQVTPAEIAVAGGVWLALMGFTLLLPALAGASFARAARLRRDRLLLSAAAGASADDYLRVLRAAVDQRLEDVNFHLRYAEALAARGDHRGAAVEARLLLVQDPYHFPGNLLLAQSYHRLGLRDDCCRVCDDYLAVAGYCFEFAELRAACGAGAAGGGAA